MLGRLRYVIPPIQDSLFTSGTKSLTELLRYCVIIRNMMTEDGHINNTSREQVL